MAPSEVTVRKHSFCRASLGSWALPAFRHTCFSRDSNTGNLWFMMVNSHTYVSSRNLAETIMGFIFFKKVQITKIKIIGKEVTAPRFGKLHSRTGTTGSEG